MTKTRIAAAFFLVAATAEALLPSNGVAQEPEQNRFTNPEASIAPLSGEAVGGFPSWAERVMLEWTNRSRSDPQADLAGCPAGACTEKACYSPTAPLSFNMALTHSARFHAAEMVQQGYFDHTSHCPIVGNINSIFPGSCNGSASCACQAFAGTTDPWSRMALFGGTGSGEIMAGHADPNLAFYVFLYETNNGVTACGFNSANGHRYLILNSTSSVGYGVSANYYVGDFGPGIPPEKIPSGSHFPQAGPTVDLWVNWYDAAPPMSATVNIDGTCSGLTLARGTPTNGAWHKQAANLGTSCHRYYFSFKDSNGNVVTYPSAGSLGIGPAGSCPEWSATRPSACGVPTGDADGNGTVGAEDIFYMINTIFAAGPSPVGNGDVNGDGKFDLSDVFYLINYIYARGPAPPGKRGAPGAHDPGLRGAPPAGSSLERGASPATLPDATTRAGR